MSLDSNCDSYWCGKESASNQQQTIAPVFLIVDGRVDISHLPRIVCFSVGFRRRKSLDIAVDMALVFHVVTGYLAFVAGPIAIMSRKGSRPHVLAGRTFFITITLSILASSIVSLHSENYSIFLLGVISLYLAVAGMRAVLRKNQPGALLDWVGVLLVFLASLALLAYWFFDRQGSFAPIPLSFGALGLVLVAIEFRDKLGARSARQDWLFGHLWHMLASYASAVTAFSVQNADFLPILIRWFWPTVLVLPLIVFWAPRHHSLMQRSLRHTSETT